MKFQGLFVIFASILFVMVGCASTPPLRSTDSNGEKVYFGKNVLADQQTKDLSLIQIKKNFGLSLIGIDELPYGSSWDGGFQGQMYINSGSHVLAFTARFGDEHQNIYNATPTLKYDFQPGKRYDLGLKPDMATKTVVVEVTEF